MTLTTYTKYQSDFATFVDRHADIIAQYEQFRSSIEKAEGELKAEVRIAGHSIENKHFAVLYVPKFRVAYNYGIISKKADAGELAIVNKTAVTISVDTKKFESLVKDGKVRIDVERAAFERTQLTPAITIKRKEIDHGN